MAIPTASFNPFLNAFRRRMGLPTGFSPFQQPTRPPAGTYDPNLDVQVSAANRGYGDLLEDVDTQNQRDTTDYLLDRGDLQRGRDRGNEDLDAQLQSTTRGFDRAGADLYTREQRGGQDYQRAINELTRNYQFLGDRQTQAARAAGVAGGSALAQAAAKRGANQAFDRAPLDTNFQRFTQDIALDRSRLGEDRQSAFEGISRSRSRLGEDFASQLGRLDLDLAPPSADNPLGGRRFQDRTTTATRAGRENTQFGIDVGAERLRQAAGNGFAPQAPSNEFRDAQGNPYRVIVRGNTVYRVAPNGTILSRRRRRGA